MNTTGFTTSTKTFRRAFAVRSRCARINDLATVRPSKARMVSSSIPEVRRFGRRCRIRAARSTKTRYSWLHSTPKRPPPRSNIRRIARSTGSANACRCACSPATSARRSSISDANSATATTRSCGKTAPARRRGCVIVRSKRPKRSSSCSPANASCRPQRRCKSSGAPVSKRPAVSRRPWTRSCRSKSAPRLQRTCSAAASMHAPDVSRSSRFACSSARRCRSPLHRVFESRLLTVPRCRPIRLPPVLRPSKTLRSSPHLRKTRRSRCSCRRTSSTTSAGRCRMPTASRSTSKSTSTRRSPNSPDNSEYWNPAKARCCR